MGFLESIISAIPYANVAQAAGKFATDNVAAATAAAAAKNKPAAPPPAAAIQPELDPAVAYVYQHADRVYKALKAAGLSDLAASYGTYQAYHETRAFTDYKYLQHNNASGIKFAGQIGWDWSFPMLGAVEGKNNYAYFNTLGDWARSMKHELTKKSRPADAITLEDYVNRLKANGYFEDSVKNYTAGMKAARLVLKVMPATSRAGLHPDGTWQSKQDFDIPGAHDYSAYGSTTPTKDSIKQTWESIPLWGKIAAGVAAFVVIKKVVE